MSDIKNSKNKNNSMAPIKNHKKLIIGISVSASIIVVIIIVSILIWYLIKVKRDRIKISSSIMSSKKNSFNTSIVTSTPIEPNIDPTLTVPNFDGRVVYFRNRNVRDNSQGGFVNLTTTSIVNNIDPISFGFFQRDTVDTYLIKQISNQLYLSDNKGNAVEDTTIRWKISTHLDGYKLSYVKNAVDTNQYLGWISSSAGGSNTFVHASSSTFVSPNHYCFYLTDTI